MAAVTDSTTATYGTTVTGGGTNHIKMYCPPHNPPRAQRHATPHPPLGCELSTAKIQENKVYSTVNPKEAPCC